MTEYTIRRTYIRKLWVPYGGLRWPSPRLIQLWRRLHCALVGHQWTLWQTDDYDELTDKELAEGEYPLWQRPAHENEWASRICLKECGAVEFRNPVIVLKVHEQS